MKIEEYKSYLTDLGDDVKERAKEITRQLNSIHPLFQYQDIINAFLFIKIAELELKNEKLIREIESQNEKFADKINIICDRVNVYPL